MNIAVYCSSRQGLDQKYIDIAQALGQWIGEHRHTLVYGGVDAGLMHVVAKHCHDSGGHVTGVNVDGFARRTDSLVDELILTQDLHERKSRMYQLADVFVVLPGGLGTADEWIATLSQMVVDNDNKRRIIVSNVDGMYDSLMRYLEEMAQSPFARDQHLSLMVEVKDTIELIDCLTKYCDKYEK